MVNAYLDRAFHIHWSRLTPDQVGPGIEHALAVAASALAAITGRPVADANFDNTFLALENATDLLNEAWSKVSHLTGVADSPELRQAYNAMLPEVSAFQAGIPLNADLWLRLKAVAEHSSASALPPEHRRLLDETMADFRQQGADLPAGKKQRLEALQAELAKLTQQYAENVLDATNAWELLVTHEGELEGLPDHAKAAARQSARQKNHGSDADPVWRFSLQAWASGNMTTPIHIRPKWLYLCPWNPVSICSTPVLPEDWLTGSMSCNRSSCRLQSST